MDLNRAYSAHQIALIRASSTLDREQRQHFHHVADSIAHHIARQQGNNGALSRHLLPAEML